MAIEDVNEGNFAAFRDCLFEIVVGKLSPSKTNSKRHRQSKVASRQRRSSTSTSNNTSIGTHDVSENNNNNDATELADFSDFIASETFSSLSDELRTLSHRALQADDDLAEKWSLPLSLTVFEELTDRIPPSVCDSLSAYNLISPPTSDLQSFMSPVITNYVAAVTVAPPKWIETRKTACEICERDWIPLTYHHLIPREVHAKVLKRGWHDEHLLNSVAWLCRACHSFVHRMASNEELAREWYTVDMICSRDDVQKWALWVGRVRWKKT